MSTYMSTNEKKNTNIFTLLLLAIKKYEPAIIEGQQIRYFKQPKHTGYIQTHHQNKK